MKCINCGEEIKSEYNNCPFCGKSIQIVPDYSIYDDDDINIIIEGTKDIESTKNRAYIQKQKEQQQQEKKKALIEAQIKKKKTIKIAAITTGILLVILVIAAKIVIDTNNNNSYSYQMKMGDGAIIKGDVESAEKYYLQALSLAENDIRVRLDLADIYLNRAEYDTAITYLEEILENEITSENEGKIVTAYKKLISIYENQNNIEAIVLLKENVTNTKVLKEFADYIVNVPKISLKPGTYEENIKISLTADKGLEIYYTIDGSNPISNGTLYTTTFEIKEDGMHTVKFVAKNEKGIFSEIVSETYVIKYIAPSDPVVTPNGGTFDVPTYVNITVPEGCSAYYTWDRTDPTAQSMLYVSPILIPEGYNMLSVIIIDNTTGLKSGIYRGMFEYIVE